MAPKESSSSARRISRRKLAVLSASGAAAAGIAGAEMGRPARAASGREKGTADVVVVGAGLAGLSAAAEIRRGGHSVVVLEGRNRVGGRTFDRRIDTHEVVELGGQWAGPGQDRVLALAKRLGVRTFETYSKGKSLMYRDGKLTRWSGPIPPVGNAAIAELAQTIGKLNSMASQVPEQPWRAAMAEQWDSQTIASWVKANMHTADARWLIELSIESVYGAEPTDVSLLDLLDTIRSVGGDLFTLIGDAQSIRFVGGTQQLSERLAGELGKRVVLEAAVREIRQRGDSLRVVTADGHWSARRALVAVPPPLVGQIAFHPPLRPASAQLAQRQPMGTAIKCNVVFDRPFWRSEGLSGATISDTGPVKITFDNSPPDGSPGVIIGFFEGTAGSDFYDRSRRRRRAATLECLARYFGEPARHPRRYLEQVWAAEPFTRGAYGSYNPPGVLTSIGHVAGKPDGLVHFAASELTAEWIGYMDGAIRSGERAAAEIVAALG